MQLIQPAAFSPVVRIANHHPVNPRQAWGPRTISDMQFICPLRGTIYVRHESGEYRAEPGQVLCILPQVRHTVGLVGQDQVGEMCGMHLELIPKASWAAGDYRCDPLPPPVSTPDEAPAVQAAFIRAADVFSGYGTYRTALLSAIANEALIRLAASWAPRATPRASSKVAAMVAHIRTHAVAGVDRHDLARVFALTPEHINALFHHELGLTPRAVLNHERCRIAYRLMHEEGLSVHLAATRAGYQDAYYFSRVFKSIYGLPPSRAN